MSRLFSRISSYTKLQRTVAYILCFFANCRKKGKIYSLTLIELNTSENIVIKHIQQHFAKEISELWQNKGVSSKQLNYIKPFLDSSDFLRVGDQLENVPIPYCQKHPILLHSKHPVVNLMIKLEHLRLGHAGTQTTLANIRLKILVVKQVKTDKR